MLIFERSQSGRRAFAQAPKNKAKLEIPSQFLRKTSPLLPEVSELEVVRHYTELSKKVFSIVTHFYPLGSCTMKYNPAGMQKAAMHYGFLSQHPYAPETHSQGILTCLYELQNYLKEITGMVDVSLAPMAGAQGEFVGVKMIKAYHQSREDFDRDEILVPDAAHGTNPASVVKCGFKVREIPTGEDGDIDLEALKAALSQKTAGIMLTNPSTLGVFERNIKEVARLVHEAGGLLYYDGANLNAILGRVRPGDMGFDVVHLNLHKTFATPHGGGGPGAGPVVVGERLKAFLPVPRVVSGAEGYSWLSAKEAPQSVGQFSTFMGNIGIALRAYAYIRMLGREGLRRVSKFACLNANYTMARLQKAGFELAFPKRRASHEFVISLRKLTKETGVTAADFAKRLLDYGFHAPTTYFPLLVAECFLIEPAETESKQTIDTFVEAMIKIAEEARADPEWVKKAPHTMSVKRLDEVKAAKQIDIVWQPPEN